MKKKIIIFTVLWLIVCFSNANAVQQMLPFPGGETWICTQGWDGTTSHFGEWKYSWDFATPSGNPISASAEGTIVYAGYNSILGNTVIIDYGNSEYGKYCHLLNTDNHPLEVSVGDIVSQGQIIGYCGNTGSSSEGAHIHYNVQDSSSLWGQSIISSFIDVAENNGVPLEWKSYTSFNYYNPMTNFKIGRYIDGYVLENMSDYRPYSRPFVTTYCYNGDSDMLGYPISNVYLLENCVGCINSWAEHVYVQDFQGGACGSATLVMNMLTHNIRFDYSGVAYPIHGQMRNYWYWNFSSLGAPVSNEHSYDGFGYSSDPGCDYVVQWFEPSENNFVAVVYDVNNGTFQQYNESSSGAPPCTVLDQAIWDNLGCPNGDCGVGGGEDPLPPSDDYAFNRSTTCKDAQSYSPYNPIDETTLFYNTDNYVCSWIQLDNIYKSLNINWKWYNPDNVLVDESGYTTDDPTSHGYEYWDWYRSWSWLNIANANNYGQWRVDIYVDGQKITTDYFTLECDTLPDFLYIASYICDSWQHGLNDEYWNLQPVNIRSEFTSGDTAQFLVKLEDVYTNHRFRMRLYRNDSLLREQTDAWLYPDTNQGWGYSSFAPYQENLMPGSYEAVFYLDTGSDFFVLDSKQFSVGGPDYTYAGATVCEGWEHGVGDDYWNLQPVNPRTEFYAGETVQLLAQLKDVFIDHEWKMELWKYGVFQWHWPSGWIDVDDVNGWGYSNFPPYVENASAGDYEFKLYLDTGNGFFLIDTKPFTVAANNENIPYFEDFSYDNHGFILEDHLSTASLYISENEGISGSRCLVLNNTQTVSSWQVQAKKIGFNISNNTHYNGQIYLKSDNPGIIYIAIQREIEPWDNMGLWKVVSVTTNWQAIDIGFTAASELGINPDNVRFAIQAGELTGKLYVDDISLN